MTAGPRAVIYGGAPPGLIPDEAGAVQVSPLHPGTGGVLETCAEATLSRACVLAPPGVAERRYVLALALRALAPGGELVALAPKDKGGARLRKELEAFGCAVAETPRRHHRICVCVRPASLPGLEAAIAAGAPQLVPAIGLWSQPGLFSWDRIDPGSRLLAQHLPALEGRGADLGCGLGYLACAVLASPKVASLTLLDIDRRAVEAARRNLDDPRAAFVWADLRAGTDGLEGLDFVVMNPPFHDAGAQDHGLGQVFIRRAAAMLRRGGACWLVANRHLPYEAVLADAFSRAEVRAKAAGFKLFEARR